MGWLDKLVKQAVVEGNKAQYFDSPAEAGIGLADAAAKTAEPSTAQIQGPVDQPQDPTYSTPQPQQPSIQQPTFAQASSDSNGMPKESTPGLTRLGKLMQILGLAGQGAMAGRAASEQAVIQSGGHRSAGFGTGFQAGAQEPMRGAMENQAVERGGLQNELERQQIATLPWVRAAQLQRQQSQTTAANALAAYRKWQMDNGKATLEEQIAAKQKIAQAANFDPEDTKQFVYGITPQKQPADRPEVPHTQVIGRKVMQWNPDTNKFDITVGPAPEHDSNGAESANDRKVWMAENPGKTIEDYWMAKNATPKSATRGQEAAAVVRKRNSLRKLENEYKWKPGANGGGTFESNKTFESLTPQEFEAKKQEVQDQYEEEVSTLSGTPPEHYDYSSGGQTQTQAPAAKPAAKTSPQSTSKGQVQYYQGHPYVFDGTKYVLQQK